MYMTLKFVERTLTCNSKVEAVDMGESIFFYVPLTPDQVIEERRTGVRDLAYRYEFRKTERRL